MKEFNFPTNIKQVGSIESGLKIYMEDYVATYLTQYATAAGYDERLATLVGRYMQIDQIPVIFISGAILGKYAEEDNGVLKFTRQSMEYIDEQIEKHFSGMEIVGWMQSQPGYGTFLNPSYKSYHKQFFGKSFQVMYVIDPLEKINTFYMSKYGELTESSGYFIYYEKNHNMHEYMMQNKVVKSQKSFRASYSNYEEPNEETASAASHKNAFNEKHIDNTINFRERVKGRGKETSDSHEDDEESHVTPTEDKEVYHIPNISNDYVDDDHDQKVVSLEAAKLKKATRRKQSRAINMLLSMSSIGLLVTFVMAAALVRGQDRISMLEEQLQDIILAHLNLMQSLQATQEVVAMVAPNIETLDGAELSNIPVQVVPGTQVPGASPQAAWPSIPNLPSTYVIQAGDSLLTISQMFYGTTAMVDQIMYVNNIDDPDMIFSGMILILPNNYPN